MTLDGTIHAGRPEENQGAHAAGHNTDSIAVCYVGGIDARGRPKDTRTAEQTAAIDRLIGEIRERHGQAIEVWGHNEVDAKACPSFNVTDDRRARRR